MVLGRTKCFVSLFTSWCDVILQWGLGNDLKFTHSPHPLHCDLHFPGGTTNASRPRTTVASSYFRSAWKWRRWVVLKGRRFPKGAGNKTTINNFVFQLLWNQLFLFPSVTLSFDWFFSIRGSGRVWKMQFQYRRVTGNINIPVILNENSRNKIA